jgi:hypothetical protein
MSTHEWKEGAQLIKLNEQVICRVPVEPRDVNSHEVDACNSQGEQLVHGDLDLLGCCPVVSGPLRCIFLCSEKA